MIVLFTSSLGNRWIERYGPVAEILLGAVGISFTEFAQHTLFILLLKSLLSILILLL